MSDAGRSAGQGVPMFVLVVFAALALAAIVAGLGIVVGTLALLLRGVLFLILFPIRLLFSLVALPFILGGLALAVVAVVGVSLVGALLVSLGVLAAAAVSLALPLALVFGACWLVARLLRRRPVVV